MKNFIARPALQAFSCATLLSVALFSGASHAADGQQFQDAPPPPVLENLEEGTPPSVTIQNPKDEPPPKNSVTQTRTPRGTITDEQVTSSGSTYHVKPPQSDSNAYDDGRKRMVVPQWTLKTFDLGGRKASKAPTTDTSAPANSGQTDPASTPAK